MKKTDSEYTIEDWKAYIIERDAIQNKLKELNKSIPKKLVEKYDVITHEDSLAKKQHSKYVSDYYHRKKLEDPTLLEKRREYARAYNARKKLEKQNNPIKFQDVVKDVVKDVDKEVDKEVVKDTPTQDNEEITIGRKSFCKRFFN